jgi:hypothetical protein
MDWSIPELGDFFKGSLADDSIKWLKAQPPSYYGIKETPTKQTMTSNSIKLFQSPTSKSSGDFNDFIGTLAGSWQVIIVVIVIGLGIKFVKDIFN